MELIQRYPECVCKWQKVLHQHPEEGDRDSFRNISRNSIITRLTGKDYIKLLSRVRGYFPSHEFLIWNPSREKNWIVYGTKSTLH